MYKLSILIFLFSFSYSQSCENSCGSGTLQEYWNGSADCVCSLDCAGYGSACCDFYDVCFENPNNLTINDFVGTWTGNITNDQTWAFDYPITIEIQANGNYSVPYNPGNQLESDSYPGSEEITYNQSTQILTFQWINYYHYACGGACYSGVYFQVMQLDDGNLTLFYNNGSGPAPQAYTLNLTLEDWEPPYQTGDVNGDEVLNVLDVISTVNIILGLAEYNEIADVNMDGSINVLDVISLVNLILNPS